MPHVTCRLTAKNRDQLRNTMLGNRVRATFTLFKLYDIIHDVFVLFTFVKVEVIWFYSLVSNFGLSEG